MGLRTVGLEPEVLGFPFVSSSKTCQKGYAISGYEASARPLLLPPHLYRHLPTLNPKQRYLYCCQQGRHVLHPNGSRSLLTTCGAGWAFGFRVEEGYGGCGCTRGRAPVHRVGGVRWRHRPSRRRRPPNLIPSSSPPPPAQPPHRNLLRFSTAAMTKTISQNASARLNGRDWTSLRNGSTLWVWGSRVEGSDRCFVGRRASLKS